MTLPEFIAKWRQVELRERSAAQEHFLDLCAVFGHPTPAAADPTGESFCFEKGAAEHRGGDGFADVWKRGFFGMEYKGRHKDLGTADFCTARLGEGFPVVGEMVCDGAA